MIRTRVLHPATERTVTIPVAIPDAVTWDAIIVGAGPAGAAVALRLARAGRRVILVDRDHMPRGKVCGCCLSPAAVMELGRLEALAQSGVRGIGTRVSGVSGSVRGALGDVVATAIPLTAVRLAAWGRMARIPLSGGVVLSREALDTALVAAAVDAGAAWLPGATVVAVTDPSSAGGAGHEAPSDAASVSIRRDGPEPITLRGHTVILTTGLSDAVRVSAGGDRAESPRRLRAGASRIGLGAVMTAADVEGWRPALAAMPVGELLMAVGHDGYCGIVRLEDGRIDLAAAVDRNAVGRTAGGRTTGGRPARPAEVVDAILAAAGGEAAHGPPPDMPWRATPPLTHTAPLVEGPTRRIFRSGDAAGYVEPFTGEGIGWALAAGRLVSEALLDSPTPAAAADRYEQLHAAHFGRRHARCRLVAQSLRLPFVVAATVRAADCAPWAARRLAPAVIGHRSGRHVARTGGSR